jgi:hypothetical protein
MKALTIALLFAIALPLAVHHASEVRLKKCQIELAAEARQALDSKEQRKTGPSREQVVLTSTPEAGLRCGDFATLLILYTVTPQVRQAKSLP